MAFIKDLIVAGDSHISGKIWNVDNFYPIGSIYISTSSTNPGSIFGGTWVAYGAGRLLIGAGQLDSSHTYAAGTSYGSYSIPAHTHSISITSGSTSPTVSQAAAGTSSSTSPTISTASIDTDDRDPGLDAADPGLSWNLGDELPDQLMFVDGQSDSDAAGIYIGWADGNRRYAHDGTNADFWGYVWWNFSHGHTYNHTHSINGHTHSIDHTHTMVHNHSFNHSHTSSHTHTVAAGTTGAPSGNVGNTDNIEPYVCVYIWNRTA